METIKVNMTPCEDVQTIHASQNDNEAREWGFELHNNGEKIDSSSISDQLVFKAYEGGTEELLPSSLMNGSVDLGSLAWTYMPNNYFRSTAVISDAKIPSNENTVANIVCSILKPNTANNVYANNEGIAIDGTGRIRIYYDDMPTDVASFTQAMQGVLLWYEKNDSTPTTSPINADIKYPQGLLTDQEFTYRESPTEEDGLANIVGIKGQTLKWNQQSQSSRETYTAYGMTISCTDGLWSFQGTYTGENGSPFKCGNSFVSLPAGHKVLLLNTSPWKVRLQGLDISPTANTPPNRIIETRSGTLADIVVHAYGLASGDTVNVQCHFGIIDLTVMFGETKANEIYAMEQATEGSGVAYFKSLFPFDFYPYNSGSLIPFMGNGIKTVGKNLVTGISQGAVGTHGETASHEKRLRVDGFVRVFQGEHYTFTATTNSGKTLQIYTRYFADANGSEQVSYLDWLNLPRSIIIPSGVNYATFTIRFGNNTNITPNDVSDAQIEHGTSATSYEPYTESVINLPISTYFPSGMKQAGDVYDELTPSKAITRIGAVTFNGSENWYYDSANALFFCNAVTDAVITDASTQSNVYTKNNRFEDKSWATRSDGSLGMYYGASWIFIKSTQFADVNALKTWLQSNPVTVYYELATPIETSFTTASLVTENAEIPLSNEDGTLIGKCTEQLSSESGFFDAKIKLTDEDGECYSNKIQLHIERSPQ